MDDNTETINLGSIDPDKLPDEIVASEQLQPESAPAEPDAAPKPKRKRKPVAQSRPPAKPAILTAGDELLAARRRARATQRVGWELFRDNVKRGRMIALAGLAIILVVGISLVTSNDYLVQSVTIVGSSALTNTQAAKMSGVLGSNIFMVNAAQVEQRLLQAPTVKSAKVQTELPNKVTISIEERKPSVVWVLSDNTPYLISDDGLIISQATTLEGYVVVYDLDTAPGSLKLGDALERDDVIDTAQQLYLRLNAVTGMNISQMEYRVAGGLTVITDSGKRLMFGDSTDLDAKLRICAALVKDLADKNQPWSQLDLRSAERVAVKS